MATEALENLVLDVLLTRAQAVTGGATYNTNPAVKAADLPLDALPQGPGQAIYVTWARTEAFEAGGGPHHRYSAFFHLFCVADTKRQALNVADDMRLSVHLGEGAIGAIAKYGIYDSVLSPTQEIQQRIGRPTVVVQVRADFELSH